jgi:hypothetical protein
MLIEHKDILLKKIKPSNRNLSKCIAYPDIILSSDYLACGIVFNKFAKVSAQVTFAKMLEVRDLTKLGEGRGQIIGKT